MTRAFCGCAIAGLTTLAGCVSFAPLDAAPEDFTLSVTVLDTPGKRALPTTPVEFRPSRYVVEPDAVLRASVGANPGVRTFPPPLRTLTRAQMQDLWSAAQDAGCVGSSDSRSSAAAETVSAVVSEPTAMIYAAAQGRRRSVSVPLNSESAEPARAMIRKLAGLAWVRE